MHDCPSFKTPLDMLMDRAARVKGIAVAIPIKAYKSPNGVGLITLIVAHCNYGTTVAAMTDEERAIEFAIKIHTPNKEKT